MASYFGESSPHLCKMASLGNTNRLTNTFSLATRRVSILWLVAMLAKLPAQHSKI